MGDFPVIPGYKFIKELGKGGMARVYLAIEEKLEREVAVKVLLRSLTEEDSLTSRFLKEAKTAAGLRHSNIVSIFDVGKEGKETYYFVMEYLEDSLKSRIKAGILSTTEILEIVSKIASALDYAHSKGFIHRDIKPDNIMFREDGTSVLVDFGIARAVGSTTKLTKTGMSIGTPHYMSPEQSRGKPLDGRSDIYALGVVLFEMLTGKTPYEAEDSDSIAIAIKHIQEPIPEIRSEVSGKGLTDSQIEHFQNLINLMMAKEPSERPQSGKDLIELITQKPEARSKEPEEKQHSAFSDQPSAKNKENVGVGLASTRDKDYKKREKNVRAGFNSNYFEEEEDLPEKVKYSKVNEDSFYDSALKKSGDGKSKKVIYLSLSLIFLVVVVIWLLISGVGRRYIEKDFDINIEHSNVSKRLDVQSQPSFVKVRAKGIAAELGKISEEDFSLRVNLNNVKESTRFVLYTEDQLTFPEGIEIISIKPKIFEVNVKEFYYKEVPVRLLYTGRFPKGIALVERKIYPKKVKIFGYKSEIKSINTVFGSERINLSEITGNSVIRIPFEKKDEILRIEGHESILVTLTVNNLNNENVNLSTNSNSDKISEKKKKERKQNSNIKSTSTYSSSSSSYSRSSYSSRVTLRSSYRTLSSNEMKLMLKKFIFFDKYENKFGNFNNDFRSKTISGDKVVVDRATGLMWHQSGSTKYITFNKAEEWIRDLNRRGYAGYSDWRLPTLEEGASLLESSKRNGVYIDTVFSKEQWVIWTGDKYDSKSGWVVSFSFGGVSRGNHARNFYVRPVRRER